MLLPSFFCWTICLTYHSWIFCLIKFFTGLLTLRPSGCNSPVQFAGTYTMSMAWWSNSFTISLVHCARNPSIMHNAHWLLSKFCSWMYGTITFSMYYFMVVSLHQWLCVYVMCHESRNLTVGKQAWVTPQKSTRHSSSWANTAVICHLSSSPAILTFFDPCFSIVLSHLAYFIAVWSQFKMGQSGTSSKSLNVLMLLMNCDFNSMKSAMPALL